MWVFCPTVGCTGVPHYDRESSIVCDEETTFRGAYFLPNCHQWASNGMKYFQRGFKFTVCLASTLLPSHSLHVTESICEAVCMPNGLRLEFVTFVLIIHMWIAYASMFKQKIHTSNALCHGCKVLSWAWGGLMSKCYLNMYFWSLRKKGTLTSFYYCLHWIMAVNHCMCVGMWRMCPWKQ